MPLKHIFHHNEYFATHDFVLKNHLAQKRLTAQIRP